MQPIGTRAFFLIESPLMTLGKVYLIGAGPGDIELLTLKAVRVLGLADVVLLDDLANPQILQFARPEAEIVRVGKRGGCQSTSQDFILREMLERARSGQCVARVKGGDPMIFGRAGEEMQALQTAGIAVEIINGISAGMAGPASIGMPLTHRDHAHGVTFVTGHAQTAGEPDWRALARSGMTLVIYMGMRKLADICEQLLAAGLAADTPAAIIQHATLPAQRQLLSQLDTLPIAAEAAGLGSPAIVVIGAVAALYSLPQSMETLQKEEA